MNNHPVDANQVQTTQTSVAAVTSMVFGIMSPIVLCSYLPTIVTSAFAIVLGHIALFKIGRSNGALLGRNRAIAGLVLGYLFLGIGIYFAPSYFKRIEGFRNIGRQLSEARKQNSMREAERQIVSDREGIGYGNTPQARELAIKFAEDLKSIRDQVIVRVTEKGDVENRNDAFVTFCQLNVDSVCFLVHIPEYRKYEDDAKNIISKAAWNAATTTMQNSDLPADAQMGVGLKGFLLYGSTMTGTVSSPRHHRKSADSQMLKKFFDTEGAAIP